MKRALLLLALTMSCRTPPRTGVTQLSGTVVLIEPVSGALVKATYFGVADSHVVGQARSDANGNFSMDLFASDGNVQLDVYGDGIAIARDPLDEVAIPLSSTDHLSVLVPNLALGESRANIVLSPWSTLMCARAHASAPTKNSLTASWGTAAQLFMNHFGGINLLSVLPSNPDTALAALDAAATQGLATTALALVAEDLETQAHVDFSTFDLLRELELDLSDGVFDGKPVAAVPLDAEITRRRLGLALSNFAISPTNQSGLDFNALVPLITAISTDDSAMYPPLPGNAAGDPAILVTSPQPNALLGRTVSFVGAVTTASSIEQLTLMLDGAPFDAQLQKVSSSETTWNMSVALPDGPHAFVVSATNGAGAMNRSETDFTVDGTPPALAWNACSGSDDSTRTGITVSDSGVQSWGTSGAAVTCADFSHLAFTTYRDLMPTQAPVLTAAISDASPSSATITLLDAGTIVAGPTAAAIVNGTVSISLSAFAAQLRGAANTDTWQVRIDATDSLGNASALSAFFSLTLLATPLSFTDVTPAIGDIARLETYDLASGAVANIPSVTLPHGGFVSTRYKVTNVSDASALWNVSASGTVDLDLHRWQGLIAAQQTAATSPSGLTFASNTPASGGDTCNNTVDSLFSQGSIPANPRVRVALPGQNANCINADDFLGSGINKLTTAAAHVVIYDSASGNPLSLDAAGNVTLTGGASATIDIGFAQPSFAADNAQMCLPNYGKTLPIDFSTASNASPYAALSFAQSTFSAPGGIAPSLLLYASTATNGDATMTDTAAGYGDCLGYTCTGSGCRVGPGTGTTDNYAFLELKYNTTYWTVWLSRLYLERGLTATGSLTLADQLVLPQNATLPGVASLPAAPVAVSIAMTNSIPIPAHAIRYTTPTF